MKTPTLRMNGKTYVVLERERYQELVTLAKAADLPPLPPPDEDGNFPAVAYARATIARGIIKDRVKAGLTQRKLAELAGIRFETLCRIETGSIRHRCRPLTASIAL